MTHYPEQPGSDWIEREPEYDVDLAGEIAEAAERNKHVTVTDKSPLSQVLIEWADGTRLLLEGHRADEFHNEANYLWETAGSVTIDEVHAYLADRYDGEGSEE